MTRFLRQEIFDALAAQSYPEDDPYKMVLFGSAVTQLFRPSSGFPIRRLARDIDLGIVLKNPSHHLSPAIKVQVGKRVMDAVRTAGAEIVEGSIEGVAGYDGFNIHKVYDVGSQRKHLRGKIEERLANPDHPLDTPLKVSEVYVRSPLLPLLPLGSNGMYHEDIREVVGAKLFRMVTSSRFQLRDVMDIYNLLDTGVLNLERDREILRTISLVHMAVNNPGLSGDVTFKALEPTDDNIRQAAESMGVEDIGFMRRVFERVYKAVETIYAERGQQQPLPPRLAGELKLTLDELNFITNLNGVEWMPGGHGQERCQPMIVAGNIVSNALEEQFPGLRQRIGRQHQLEECVSRSLSRAMTADF